MQDEKSCVSIVLATRSCVDSLVIDAMACCHDNGAWPNCDTEGPGPPLAINMHFVASGGCACCLWQIR